MAEIVPAQPSLTHLIEAAESLDQCDRCLSEISVRAEGGTQSVMSAALLQRVRDIVAKPATSASRAASLELSLLLALGRFAEFNARYDEMQNLIVKEQNLFLLAAVRRRLGLPRMDVFRERKVFGIGLSKTGTTTLSHALDVLGIDNGHYTNPLTRQILSDIDFFLLGGATDTPVSQSFEKLFYLYPNAKFVLTTRPIEDWSRSMATHYGRPSNSRGSIGRPSGIPFGFLGEAVQVGLYLHHDQFERAFADHEQRVRRFFADKPPDRLLVFNVFEGNGWTELCEFLGSARPQSDFPWSNRRRP